MTAGGLRVGVIGLGRIGVMHARNLARHPEVAEVLLLGRDATRLARGQGAVEAALAPGALPQLVDPYATPTGTARVRATTDLERAFGEVDGIVVATSTPSHPELARRAARAGVPALVEKPLALDAGELAALSDELDAAGSPVMVAFHRRYDPGHQSLRAAVQDGSAGTVRVVRATDHDHPPLSLDYIPGSGGIWRDLMIHDFDVIPWVLDDTVVRVSAFGAVLDEPEFARYGDVDTAVAVLELGSGALAVVTAGRRNGAGQDVRLEVVGSEQTFAVGYDDRLAVTPVDAAPSASSAPRPLHADFVARFGAAFQAEVDHFVRLVAGTAENLTPPRAGLQALHVAVAAEESWRTGRPVRPDPARAAPSR